MMAQVPLVSTYATLLNVAPHLTLVLTQVAITKYLYRKFPGSSLGNVVFWLTFCVVGQPMAILMYTIDYKYGQFVHEHPRLETMNEPQCRFMLGSYCIGR
jgi:hypothetical protein